MFVGAALPACGGGGANKDETAAEPGSTEKVTEQGKKWGGWRWKGERDDCFFLHDNKCFDSLAKACKAAKCAEGACQHDESAPAKVSCK